MFSIIICQFHIYYSCIYTKNDCTNFAIIEYKFECLQEMGSQVSLYRMVIMRSYIGCIEKHHDIGQYWYWAGVGKEYKFK